MSIGGLRATHALAHDDYYADLISEYAFRHHVKPGLDWLGSGGTEYRGETPTLDLMARRVELDLWYVDNRTFALDVQIVVRTAIELLRSKAAY